MDEKTKAEREATRGGYLAAIAKRKGISIEEARAEQIKTTQEKVLDLAREIETGSPDDKGPA